MFIGNLSTDYSAVAFSPLIAKGLDWLRGTDFTAVADGTHEIVGRQLYAIVQSYTTRTIADSFWEAHRKYTDIQMLLAGRELFGYAHLATLTETHPYDAERDLHKLTGTGHYVELSGRQFIIAEPADAHMPGVCLGTPIPIRKVVLKVAVGS